MSNFTSHTRKTGACPICGEYAKGCKTLKVGNPDILTYCRKISPGTQIPGYIALGDGGGGLWQMYKEGEASRGWSDEEKAEFHRDRDARKALAFERDRQAKITAKLKATPSEQRDRHYRHLIKTHSITPEHRAHVLSRKGMTDDRIVEMGLYSKQDYKGDWCLYAPIPSIDGLLVGAQLKDFTDGSYKWDNAGDNKLKETGDLPLAIWGNRVNPDLILLVEGTGFKPYLASKAFPNALVIGAAGGQHASSKEQLLSIIMRYSNVKVMLAPDSGAMFNSSVSSQYAASFEAINTIDRLMSVGFWKQYAKPHDGDIDEIDIATTEIKEITFDRYEKLCDAGAEYKKLIRLTGQTEIRNERYLSPLPELKRGEMTFVSSPVGTGKTTILEAAILEWLKNHPNGKIVIVSHRNSLMNQMCDRLSINSYRVGNGLEDAYINGEQKVAIVVDSLELLDVDRLPENVLVIIDECEGVLKHITLGGTTGNKTSKIQSHLTAVFNRVMVTGGHILGLEDSLTDISIKGIKDLTGNKYKVNIIENQYEAFKYAVKMGGKNDFKHFINALVMRLRTGEKIALATTSQRFGEAVHKAIDEYVVGTKIERLDATTIEKLGDLTRDPVSYLRAAQCQLFIYSPTVESGFNIDDKGENPLFDAMFAYFVNLDTRAHIQMLSRYRSNCPRYIYTSQKGAEQAVLANSPVKLNRMYQQIANQTSLEQGKGRIVMSAEGAVWNRLVAEFECRSHYSAQYLHEYLRVNLLERGHDVSVVDWQTETIEIAAKYGIEIPDAGEIADRYGEIKIELLDRDATALYEADGKISIEQAESWLHSSHSTTAQKIRAKKAKLHERLPGMEFSYGFIRECVIEDSGAYLRQIEFRYLIDKPELAKELDRLNLESQSKESHIIYSRVPKNFQKVRLFGQIASILFAIVDRGWCGNNDADSIALWKFAIAHSFEFWSLFGLTMREDMTVNTIVTKILKKLGWQTERQKGKDRTKKGDDTYLIVNRDCQHAKDIEQALERRYAKVLAGMSEVSNSNTLHNIESADIDDRLAISNDDGQSIEDIASILRLAITHPEEYQLYRSVLDPKLMDEASKLLSEIERSALKKIVIEHNNRAA